MAESIALHTKLKPGTADEYADAHGHIPPELVAALKEAGVKNWRIWQSGLDLFHVVDVENYQAMRHALADHPANVPWQARMAELLAVQDDYSGEDAGIQKVWELP